MRGMVSKHMHLCYVYVVLHQIIVYELRTTRNIPLHTHTQNTHCLQYQNTPKPCIKFTKGCPHHVHQDHVIILIIRQCLARNAFLDQLYPCMSKWYYDAFHMFSTFPTCIKTIVLIIDHITRDGNDGKCTKCPKTQKIDLWKSPHWELRKSPQKIDLFDKEKSTLRTKHMASISNMSPIGIYHCMSRKR